MILSLSPPSTGVRLLGYVELQDFANCREYNAWSQIITVIIFAVIHWISIQDWRPIPASVQTEHEIQMNVFCEEQNLPQGFQHRENGNFSLQFFSNLICPSPSMLC